MKNRFKYRPFYILAFALLMLLISACTARKVTKTTTTVTRQIDTIIELPERRTNFISRLPKQGDSIVLTDRKTGVQLTIKEFVSIDDILTDWSIPNPEPRPELIEGEGKTEYEFQIIEPEKEIVIEFDETTTTKNKEIEKAIPWYYQWSLKIVIWLLLGALVLFILKKTNIWQLLKR